MQRLATGLQNGVARFTLVWSIASALSSITTAGWSQTLTWLGTLGGYRSWAKGVSADGSVVVGWARNAAGWDRAFRWTAAGGMQDIGTLGGNRSEAFGVSADGSVVIGEAQSAEKSNRLGSFLAFPRICAFRWTVASGVQDLGRLPGGSDSWLEVFPRTAPWWSAVRKLPQEMFAPFAGQRLRGWWTSAR
jgi:probable HAF family extracellular repeat protein